MFSAGVFEAFSFEEHYLSVHHMALFLSVPAIFFRICLNNHRTRKIIENYVSDKRYCSINNWVKKGSIFGFDFIFEELPKKITLPIFNYFTIAVFSQVGTTRIYVPENQSGW